MTDVQPAQTVEATAEAAIQPLSKSVWFQMLDHCWRPVGGWLVAFAIGFAFVIGPLFMDKHLNEGELFALVSVFAALWGLKTYEKTKIVGSAP